MPVKETDLSAERVVEGIGVSPGMAVGEVVVFARDGWHPPEYKIHEQEISAEIVRFEEALIQTRCQIAELRRKVQEGLGAAQAGIFDAHLLVVEDRYFIEEVIRELRETHLNAEAVVMAVADRYVQMLDKIDDDYLRERAADVSDVTRRIVKNLAGESIDRMDRLEHPCIAAAHDFSPSDTAGIDRNLVHALISDLGSPTSHAAIMARALEVPAVVGLHNISTQVHPGQTVLVDGGRGIVIIDPSSECLLAYARRAEDQKQILCSLESLKDKPSETRDGRSVPIAANIELPSELSGITKYGAKGIGLFRTEFLFMDEQESPNETRQAEAYRAAAEQCNPDRVVIRTLDLGGDKISDQVRIGPESNPFLGWRAIRFCLAKPDFFKTQLRAVLRASAGGNLALLYPMICCVNEITEANQLLEECRRELRKEGAAFDESMPVGVMIEIPSAALTADILAPHVDFFSIGTNDLIQYTLAVDRINENVAHLYKPTHIAILKLIHRVVRSAHEHRIPVAVCGEMAATPELVPLLIGLGVDELSITPSAVPMVKDVIRNLKYTDCRKLAGQALREGSCDDVLNRCIELLEKTAPEVLELTR